MITIDKWGNRIAQPDVTRKEFDALKREVERLKALILKQRNQPEDNQLTAPR